jgi:tRNA/rRNA methyltransferase
MVAPDREPVVGARSTSVAEIVHACHEKTIDDGLAQLDVPGLDRASLEPVLTYCAELRCEADQATCPGCKRRTEAMGLHTLDDFIRAHAEIVVGDGTVRLVGQGQGTVRTPALAALEKTWSGENYWFWARRVQR